MNYATKLLDQYEPRLGTNVKDIKQVKNPMLIVGANAYIRTIVKWNALQSYDIYLLFQPNSNDEYTIGCILLNKLNHNDKHITLSINSKSTKYCLEQLGKSIDTIVLDKSIELESNIKTEQVHPKLNVWLIHWIYRCPKISLKDVLHLEAYK